MRIPAALLLAALLAAPAVRADDTADADSMRAAYMAREMALNAPGTPAADAMLELADASRCRLSDFRGQRLLLVLFDPECDDCHQALTALADALPAGLTALALYAEGERELWPAAQAAVPEGFTAAFDPDGVYSLGTFTPELTPGIYLIAPDGTVEARSGSAADIIPLLDGQ